MSDPQSVAVIGAGTMGEGIANVFARHAYDVSLVDIDGAQLNRAVESIAGNLQRQVEKGRLEESEREEALGRISTSSDMDEAAAADLIIEAIPEKVQLKTEIISRLASSSAVSKDAIVASNTSSISITALARHAPDPTRMVGMHFMNPVPVMELVEVIRGLRTADDVAQTVMDTARRLQKTPVEVHDFPGFVSNRVLMPMINEAVFCLMEGVAEPEAIDTVMKLGMNHPMGPLALADLIGLDTCHSILEVLQRDLGEDKYRPCPLLSKYVAAGWLGRKTGRGFYSYED